ncbi:MAG TPA: DUF4149 domain-containing protein [Thermoanaerobaculia bacterium]|nr:DUF4149 domain-containing protein [Thermoanaerobaculia bacterium]
MTNSMHGMKQRLRDLLIALWLGSGAFLMAVAAPAAFERAPDRTTAAAIVGAMLTKWHYIAIGAPLILLVVELRRRVGGRNWRGLLLATILMLASTQALLDLRIRAIRQSSPIPISNLDEADPVRRRFGMLHGVSSLMMLLQVLGAAAVLAGERVKNSELRMENSENRYM